MKRVRRYNYVKFMREIMGRFVGGESLFYPYELIRKCVRNIEPIDISRPIRPQLLRYGEINCIRIGIDMAKAVDATAIIVWAEDKTGILHPIYWIDWRKKDYHDQYRRIGTIVKPFQAEGFWVKIKVDSTGTQDANTDSIRAIAGICDETGRVLGMMPHPEAALFFTQLPDWVRQKEERKRKGLSIPAYGPGLALFVNAVEYLRQR